MYGPIRDQFSSKAFIYRRKHQGETSFGSKNVFQVCFFLIYVTKANLIQFLFVNFTSLYLFHFVFFKETFKFNNLIQFALFFYIFSLTLKHPNYKVFTIELLFKSAN